jgi:hypothetical protein
VHISQLQLIELPQQVVIGVIGCAVNTIQEGVEGGEAQTHLLRPNGITHSCYNLKVESAARSTQHKVNSGHFRNVT